MSSLTFQQYDEQSSHCRSLFLSKAKDYGTSWRVMRIPSLIDQIFIKVQRLRSIEDKQVQKVEDSIESEYIGIINYAIITLIQIELGDSFDDNISLDEIMVLYDKYALSARTLMANKNHDYGEAWRDMMIHSFTDIMLARIHRMRQILLNKGKTIASEGIDANLYDMINYSAFALIRLKEAK